ncbi:50S ribosomal protein L1 [Lentisphaera profundi]|uniref:Large ribosomal subunit protein uL1 n=1 Tax=Lentisphaera profundi TaxID=1658616 RepID=A0ABY7VZN6_9BACT|nr:50S ribosomal protein L1 [Lentisphaera profundi]WDE98723.1 50S ribosomal protein L1 [Lentisphaera profundi]
MKRSKLYNARLEKVDVNKAYSFQDAFETLKALPAVKFDESVDVAFQLGIDTRQPEQNVRGALSLPNGTGKNVTVVVIADGNSADEAKAAGADYAGYDEMIAKIKDGWLDFDVLIATPSAMSKVRTLGRVLGPRGLMPNPKTGTVTDDVAGAVKASKGGRVEYRADKGGATHVLVGKLSFDADKLTQNVQAIVEAILKARPSSTKGTYVVNCTVSSTMSPGLKIDLKDLV